MLNPGQRTAKLLRLILDKQSVPIIYGCFYFHINIMINRANSIFVLDWDEYAHYQHIIKQCVVALAVILF